MAGRFEAFALIQAFATLEDGFGPEHCGKASIVFHPRKQRTTNEGILRRNVEAIELCMSQAKT